MDSTMSTTTNRTREHEAEDSAFVFTYKFLDVIGGRHESNLPNTSKTIHLITASIATKTVVTFHNPTSNQYHGNNDDIR